jgi:hypothetical protein
VVAGWAGEEQEVVAGWEKELAQEVVAGWVEETEAPVRLRPTGG